MPAAFLINTEENKLQVVESGWLNILLNTINLSKICLQCKQTDDVIPLDNAEESSKDDVHIVSDRIAKNSLPTPNNESGMTKNSHCSLNVPAD